VLTCDCLVFVFIFVFAFILGLVFVSLFFFSVCLSGKKNTTYDIENKAGLAIAIFSAGYKCTSVHYKYLMTCVEVCISMRTLC
jgi:hypothetical protein